MQGPLRPAADTLLVTGYRSETKEKFADLLCRYKAGQFALARAIPHPRVVIHEAASLGTKEAAARYNRVMERALKHKFPVGSSVYFTASNISRPAATGTYEVVRQLPSDGDDCQYRIKSSTEAFERVAKESQLAMS